jgi:hypothetical protein
VVATSQLKLDNIQGNILAGFNKDHQTFLFVNFPTGSDPKGWFAQIIPDVASTAEVAAFNSLFKLASARRGSEHTLKSSWMNVALSASGLRQLGIPQAELESFPAAFKAGMSARASEVGDTGSSAPEHWIKPFGSTDVHAVMLLAIPVETREGSPHLIFKSEPAHRWRILRLVDDDFLKSSMTAHRYEVNSKIES